MVYFAARKPNCSIAKALQSTYNGIPNNTGISGKPSLLCFSELWKLQKKKGQPPSPQRAEREGRPIGKPTDKCNLVSVTPRDPLSHQTFRRTSPSSWVLPDSAAQSPDKMLSADPTKYFKHFKQFRRTITIKSERYGPLLMWDSYWLQGHWFFSSSYFWW